MGSSPDGQAAVRQRALQEHVQSPGGTVTKDKREGRTGAGREEPRADRQTLTPALPWDPGVPRLGAAHVPGEISNKGHPANSQTSREFAHNKFNEYRYTL